MQSGMHNWTILSSTTWSPLTDHFGDRAFSGTEIWDTTVHNDVQVCGETGGFSLRRLRRAERRVMAGGPRWSARLSRAAVLPTTCKNWHFLAKEPTNFLKFRPFYPLEQIKTKLNFRRLNPDTACQRKKEFLNFIKWKIFYNCGSIDVWSSACNKAKIILSSYKGIFNLNRSALMLFSLQPQ